MKTLAAFIPLLVLGGCQLNPITCDQACEDSWMDGPAVNDSTAHDSLLSVRNPNPNAADLQKNVIVAVHGFSASTYEWKEFKRYADSADSNVLVSLVLLGGHGRDWQDFADSSWHAWAVPILTEYQALAQQGYRHISLVGSSTACTLILQQIHDGAYDTLIKPKQLLFIDPIIVPTSKILSTVDIFGPIVGNSPNPGTAAEDSNWYVNRPATALAQLYQVVNLVKNELESGIHLPEGIACKVYKSAHDNAADPVGALYLYKGLVPFGGGHIDVQMVNSSLHVFTRLQGRDPATLTAADTTLQRQTFADILARVEK